MTMLEVSNRAGWKEGLEGPMPSGKAFLPYFVLLGSSAAFSDPVAKLLYMLHDSGWVVVSPEDRQRDEAEPSWVRTVDPRSLNALVRDGDIRLLVLSADGTRPVLTPIERIIVDSIVDEPLAGVMLVADRGGCETALTLLLPDVLMVDAMANHSRETIARLGLLEDEGSGEKA